MILVSYIDILDFIGDDRLCLIEGEELFNENNVSDVQVLCRSPGECYDVSALCQGTSHSQNVNVCIKIDQNKKKSLLSNCTCVPGGTGKCGHVAAILIYLHRNTPTCTNDSIVPKSLPKSEVQSENTDTKTDNSVPTKEEVGKGVEEQYRRKLRHKRSLGAIGSASRCESKSAINKAAIFDKVETNEDIDDPTWDKENDREDDDTFDFSPSSDDDWKPSPDRKRTRREITLFSSENPKGASKTSRKKKRELTTPSFQGDGQFKCHLCDVVVTKEDDLRSHLKTIHLMKREIFSCSKCKKVFKSCRTLKNHENNCDMEGGEDEDENEDVECETATTRTESQKKSLAVPLDEEEEEDSSVSVEPLQCLLCDVAAGTRREMHDHYILAHRTHKRDTVSVCDRCGEFRLPSDHICPSQLAFRCRTCRVSFKAGRDYWNHLIRLSKAHAARDAAHDAQAQAGGPAQAAAVVDRWRCGWPRCAERFPAEEELVTHVRLHLPQHAAHMCAVCGLLLRNADAKVAHLAKHDSGMYECEACAHACSDKEALRQHWEEHAAERPHRCDACGWRFACDALLQVHARKVHEGGPFSCAKCPSTFSDRTDVRVHFGAAHGKLRCPQASCTFRCTSKASLRRHDALAHAHGPRAAEDDDDEFNADDPAAEAEAGDDAPLTCPTAACEETFAKRAELRAHVRRAHDGVPVACPECSKPFRSRRALDEHVRLHTGEKPFICAECGMTFKRAQNLEHHTKGAHKNERNFSCPECAKRFISNADMQRHLRYSHQGGKKWHLCTVCGHKAPSLYNLKQHVQSRHTGERPHKCHMCEAGFVARADLKKHVMYKHNKEQPFACSECDRRYQRRRDLQLHQQRHHSVGSHACAECGKDFDSYASMMQHARYHTSEEAFQCAKCGRRFPHRMNLSRHLCTPDIKKNFRCATCGLSFTTSGSLKSHRRRLHPAEDAADAAKPKQAKTAKPAVEQQQQQQQQQQEEVQSAVEPQGLQDQQPQPPLGQPQPLPQTSPPPPAAYLQPQTAQPPVIHHAALHHQQLLPQPPQQPPRHYEPQQQQQAAPRGVPHRLPQLVPQPHEAVLQIRQHVVVHQPRHHQEEEDQQQQQHIASHHDQQHMTLGEVHEARYEDYDKDSGKQLWRGVAPDAWAMNPAVATSAALAQDDTILTLTTCSTYHELESVPAAAPAMAPMQLMHAPSPAAATAHTPPPPPPPSLVVQQSNVLRYTALPPPPATLLVKAAPPPLVSLQVKADHHQMMYAQAAGGAAPGPTPTVKLVSVSSSQPPPLASLSSTQQGQLLAAPIQTTADGSIHLVFVPAHTK